MTEINRILQYVQKNLERIYDLELDADISDYLIGENRAREAIDWGLFYDQLSGDYLASHPETEVEINGAAIINEEGGGGLINYKDAWLGLYLSEETISNIIENNPLESIDSNNFRYFQTLLEETSHIAYSMHAIKYQKPFTKLEQEFQACVDQFLLTVFHIGRINNGAIPKGYIDYFTDEDVYVLPYMDAEFRGRYKTATSMGARYCKYLYESHLKDFEKRQFKREVVDFYSRTQTGKIERVRQIEQ